MNQPPALFGWVVAPSPIQVRDFVQGANLAGGVSMAFQTKRHAKRLCVIYLVHFVNRAVAFHAADAPIDVNGMIEIDVIRQFVDLHPRNGRAGTLAFAHQSQPRIFLKHLIVAVHANRSGRNVGKPGLFNGAVAITAV